MSLDEDAPDAERSRERAHAPASGVLAPERATKFSWRRTFHRLGRLFTLVRPYRAKAILSAITLLVGTAIGLVSPFASKFAIDRGIVPGDRHALIFWTVLFVVAALLGWVASVAQTYLSAWVGQRVLADLRRDLFAHIQTLELGYFERNRAGWLISRLTNDVDALEELVTDGLYSTVQNTLLLFGTAGVLLYLDWRLALATLTVFPLMALATTLFRVYSARAYRRMRERLADVTATLAEDIAGMRVVQSFRARERQLPPLPGGQRRLPRRQLPDRQLNAWYFPFVELLGRWRPPSCSDTAASSCSDDAITIGTLFAFVLYLSNFFDPVQQLSQLYNTFLAASAAHRQGVRRHGHRTELRDAPTAGPLPPIAGKVEFENVRFAYAPGAPRCFNGIDLTVAAGQTVALVGHTGAGKSTVVKLLARFYDPTSGRVLIDGHDLRDVTAKSLRRQLGIVPQEGFLFAAPVRENIAFGRPDASLDDVVAAAQAVGADEFIRALPEGYDTQIDERGARLSIGQRQLVAFARALLADPRILILDEATSSVDIPTEARIEEALQTLLAGRTALVVAHRLSTIRGADVIVVLEHGEVIEQGTHRQLLELRGRYYALYDDWAEPAA